MKEFLTKISYKGIVNALVDGFVFTVERVKDGVHDGLLHVISIAAPAPSAVSVYIAFAAAGYQGWQAFLFAAVIEACGIATTRMLVGGIGRADELDLSLKGPLLIPVLLFGIYFAGAEISIFLYESLPAILRAVGEGGQWSGEVRHITPMFYPLFTFVGAGYGAYHEQLAQQDRKRERASELEAERDAMLFEIELENLRKDADARRDIERVKAEAAADAKRAKANRQTVQRVVQHTAQNTVSTPSKAQSEDEQRHLLETHLLDNGWTGASALAKATNLSRSTVYNRLRELSERGRARNENGKWDVVRDIPPTLPAPAQIHLNGNGVMHDQP